MYTIASLGFGLKTTPICLRACARPDGKADPVHNSGGDGGFDVYIGRLRMALNDDEAPTFLRPVRSAGYASIVAHIWIAFGHEDLVDHDDLRRDPTMAVLAGKLSARRWLARARSIGSIAVRARRRAISGAQTRQWVVDPEGQVMALRDGFA